MQSPCHYVALFGDPNPPQKDAVESGIYHPHPSTAPFRTNPGDVLLLYCAASYHGHEMDCPGIGIVLACDSLAITYRSIPFETAIPKHKMDSAFTADDSTKFRYVRFNTFWLFEIAQESFARTVNGQRLHWPK